MRAVRAGTLGVDEIDGVTVAPDAMVVPCLTVLPMGFSWALHWTQQAHRCLLARSGVGSLDREFLDGLPAPSLSHELAAHLIYVDNQLYVSSSPTVTEFERNKVRTYFTRNNMPLHEIIVSSKTIEVIGLELDGVRQSVALSCRRRWRLRRALDRAIRHPFLSGQQLEVLIGHVTHAALLNRPTLATLRACYDFIKCKYRVKCRLWSSVVRELKQFRGLIICLTVDWSLRWSNTVTCSDACPHGYAVQESVWAPSEVRAVAAWSDRWRFRLGAGLNPRERALALSSTKTVKDIVYAPAAITNVDSPIILWFPLSTSVINIYVTSQGGPRLLTRIPLASCSTQT